MMLFVIAVLLSSCILVAISSPMVTLTSNVTFNGDATLLCSSKPIQFTCEGTQLAFLAWSINNEIIEDFTLLGNSISPLPHGLTIELTRFIVDVSRRFADFTSVLTAESSALSDGDVVECREGRGVSDSITVRFNQVLDHPPAPIGFQTTISANKGTTNLTLQWSESFTTAHNIEMYCVQGLEMGTSCYGRRCVSSSTSYHCDGLHPGRYGFKVQAINCGDQEGEESETFTINPQLPASPNSCTCVPVYEQMTNRLSVIQNTWSSVQNPPHTIVDGQSQDVLHYIISYTSSDGHTQSLTISADDVCTSESLCTYNISTEFKNNNDSYTVTVTAVNLVGEGDPCVCSQSISTVNDFVTVLPNTVNQTEPIITCHITETAAADSIYDSVCTFCYGTGPPCHTSTCSSPITAWRLDGADGLFANVSLTELEDGIHYQFHVNASIGPNRSTIVVGTFSTACVSADLAVVVSPISTRGVNNRDFIDLRCAQSDVGSLRISHGVICYNGTSVGSVATYICDDGYHVPNVTSQQRICLANGNWEGDVLICIEPQPGHLSVGGATSIAFLTIATTILGVVTGVLVYCVIFLSRKNQKLKETLNSGSTSPVQPQNARAIDQQPAVQTQEYSVTKGNGAVKYAAVTRPQRARGISIDTRGNMAYQYGQVKQ